MSERNEAHEAGAAARTVTNGALLGEPPVEEIADEALEQVAGDTGLPCQVGNTVCQDGIALDHPDYPS